MVDAVGPAYPPEAIRLVRLYAGRDNPRRRYGELIEETWYATFQAFGDYLAGPVLDMRQQGLVGRVEAIDLMGEHPRVEVIWA